MTTPTEATDRPPQTFRYRAAQATGTITRGTVVAADEAAAVIALRAQGMVPLRVTCASVTKRAHGPRGRDVGAGLRILANLLAASIPLSRALATFEELAPRSWRAAAGAMRERIRVGGRLADALKHDAGLSPVLVGIIAAGEAAGAVAPAMLSSATLAEESAALRAAIVGALVYPAILFVAGLGSVALLVGVVLPRFAVILADLGERPPALTRAVLALSAFVTQTGWLTLGLTGASLLAFQLWRSTDLGRARWDAALLRIPGIGTIRGAAASSRVCASMAALLTAGLPVARALTHAADAAGDTAIRKRLLAARAGIVRGDALGLALESARALTTPAVRLIRAGEESGRVADMFAHAGRMEAERARELLRGAVRLVEPALILVFGALVAVVSGSLLQAVYAVHPTR